MADRPRLFLVDGSALAYRSYYAFIKTPLINSKGQNTGAVFGFTSALLRLIEKEAPEHVTVVFDSREPTFRHERFPEYKATRQKMPDEMAEQLPLIDEVSQALGLPILRCPGYEADDIIGTLARRAEAAGWDCFIVTGDKDFMQLVGDHIRIYDPARKGGEPEIIDREGVLAKFGVPPEKVVDVLGLMGDTSDNIPGVEGIGPKTATELVQAYGSLEAALDHAAELKAKRPREGLLAGRESALLSKELATIRTDAPVSFDPHDLDRTPADASRLVQLFEQLEFPSLLDKLQLGGPKSARAAYHTVTDPKALDDLIARLRQAGEFVLDVETTSIWPMDAEIVGLSFAVREGEAFYVPVNEGSRVEDRGSSQHQPSQELFPDSTLATSEAQPAPAGDLFHALDAGARDEGRGTRDESEKTGNHAPHSLTRPSTLDPRPLPLAQLLGLLRPVLEDPRVRKGGQNIKYDLIVLANQGVEVQGVAFDTMVESYLLDPSQRQHNLDLLALKHLSVRKTPTEALLGKGKSQITMREVPIPQVAAYSCEDADVTLRLHHLFLPRLEELDLERLYHDVEVPLIGVLERIERRGVRVDLEKLAALSADFAARIDALTREIRTMAGEEFNLNSTQQLGTILFEKLQIHKGRGLRVKRTKTGYGTSVEALEDFADHPFVQRILEYRTLTKLKGTYVDAFPELVNRKTGKIHTSFNQTVTATGRLSSSDPNLQNIPIRTELGRQIREAFIPSDPRRRLLCADYSQIELRVLAHLSADPGLMDAFRHDMDIHRRTASEIFGVPMDQVTPEMRSRSKAINFGIIYGMGPQRLAHDTGITMIEAQAFIDRYFERYPLVKKFIDETIAAARRDGFVATLMGRRRLLPEIHSSNQGTRSAAERVAVNTPIQGTAADLIKVAMIRIDQRLRESHPDAWMILQVHDELVFDVLAEEAEAVAQLVRQEMEGALRLDVPLKVDIAIGTTWAKG